MLELVAMLLQFTDLVLQVIAMLADLMNLMLKLTVVVIQAGDLMMEIGFHFLMFVMNLLQTLVGVL